MEVLLNIENYEEKFCDDRFNYSKAEKERIKRDTKLDHITKVDFVNIGTGADWIVILIVLSFGLRILKVGKEINEGIDSWIDLGKKLRGLFRRKRIVSVDKDAAAALAINLIAQRTKIDKLVKVHDNTINFTDVSGMLPRNKGLSKKPHNYYIQAYLINDRETYVIGIQSNGEAKILSHYDF
ncbi:MAG: hypothetical protein J6Y35_06625 [Bacteroidales bacterium]|nr:hypothetical protein [Bacteroidales bacterium]